MTEERPGFYSGAYRVKADDRVQAGLSLTAQEQEGAQEQRELGQIALQGLSVPQLTTLSHVDLSDWLLEGEAPAGSEVKIDIAIRVGGLFGKRTKRRSVETVADEQGQFQARLA